MKYLAHGDEHVEAVTEPGLLNALTHQPLWLSVLIIAFFLFGIYALLEKLRVKPLNRVMALVPLMILVAIIYMEHSPAVSTAVLTLGFVGTFGLAFTMMTANKDKNDTQKDKPDGTA